MSSTPRFLLGALLLFPLALLAQGKKRPDLPLEMSRLPAVPTMPDAFPQVIGTQVFGPAYKFTKDVQVRLNLYNVFDERYISQVAEGGGQGIPGEGRQLIATLRYDF